MSIKALLLDYSKKYFKERADQANEALIRAQESANEEQKSSAGDKYETSRAMGQIARDMYAKNLDIAQQTIKFLNAIQLKNSSKVELGSLVHTSDKKFFISASIGNVKIENEDFYFISLATPIGRLLENKLKGDKIIHQGNEIEILMVE